MSTNEEILATQKTSMFHCAPPDGRRTRWLIVIGARRVTDLIYEHVPCSSAQYPDSGSDGPQPEDPGHQFEHLATTMKNCVFPELLLE
jgi:hypothetical protein